MLWQIPLSIDKFIYQMKRILIATLMLLLYSAAQAQAKYEYSVYGQAGISTLKYKLSKKGERESDYGGGGGAGFTYYLNDRFGVTTGLELNVYNAQTSYSQTSGQYTTADITGDQLSYTYSISGYEEKQKTTILSIPIMGQLLFPVSKKNDYRMKLFAAGGFKLGIPLKSTFTTDMGSIATTGTYLYEGITYTNLPQHGLTSDWSAEGSGDINLGFSSMVSLEFGARFDLEQSMACYVGLYLDYGLNTIQKDDNLPLNEYNAGNPSEMLYNSVLNSSYVKKGEIRPLAFGVKLRFTFCK